MQDMGYRLSIGHKYLLTFIYGPDPNNDKL